MSAEIVKPAKPFFARALSIEAQFRLLLGGIVVALLALSLWSYRTLSQVAVNGPLYNRVVMGKDLESDILPPPQYVVESFLLLNQIRAAAPAQRAPLMARLEHQRELFYAGHDAWNGRPLPEGLKRMIAQDVFRPADAFFREYAQGFVPALVRFDQGDRGAVDASYARLAADYESNRAAVDALVLELGKYQHVLEDDARRTIMHSYVWLGIVSLILLALAVLLVLRQMAASIARRIRYHEALSKAHRDAYRQAVEDGEEAARRAVLAIDDAERRNRALLALAQHEVQVTMRVIASEAQRGLYDGPAAEQRDRLETIKMVAEALPVTVARLFADSEKKAGGAT
ncbi:MAG: hypothetical protein JO269_12755 [Burkholderiaceae bacterium]|nr:hypothetical protein [Burkholderiaceae bacterium]